MPPKRTPIAPANGIYRTSTPLQQSRFPLRSTRVKYGKQSSKQVSLQETLTQMDFVNLHRPPNRDNEDLTIYEEEAARPKKKRRKTSRDEPSSESKYHTQTLTQIGNWSFATEPKEDEGIYDVLNSSLRSKKLRPRRASEIDKPQKPTIQGSSRRPGTSEMVPPETPQLRQEREILSSESPATPPSQRSSIKSSLLKERSINIPIPFNTYVKTRSSPHVLPQVRFDDTFESQDVSQHHRPPSTPCKRSGQAKNIRWAGTDKINEIEEKPPLIERQTVTTPVAAKSTKDLREEILDSEDDSGDYEVSEGELPELEKEKGPQGETCCGEIGFEDQKLLKTWERPSPPSQLIKETEVLGGKISDPVLEGKHHVDESQILGREISSDMTDENTQHLESQRLATQYIQAMASRTTSSDAFVSMQPQNVTKILDRTKNHEFRRQKIPDTVRRIWIYETYPTRVLKYMAVISAAKRPGEIEKEDGIGNAEFNAKDPECGEFAWEILELYELADPLPWVKIEANEWLSDPPKKPTFLRPAVLDQLMANLKPPIFFRPPLAPELPTSLSTDTPDAEEQLLLTMIQYTQTQPLMTISSSRFIRQENKGNEDSEHGNEDEPEFLYHAPQDSHGAVSIYPNVSSSQINKDASENEDCALPPQKPTHSTMAPPKDCRTQSHLPSFSQAETVDVSQSQTPGRCSTSDIVFESPPRHKCSNTPINLTTSREGENIGQESLIPYSMNSSQLMTKSQMLPAGLLNDSAPGLPWCIQDSDEEDEL